jgi:hypothetical protein
MVGAVASRRAFHSSAGLFLELQILCGKILDFTFKTTILSGFSSLAALSS